MTSDAKADAAYPQSFTDIERWAAATQSSLSDSRIRFAQFVILCAIAGDPLLKTALVFKGGNALDFVLHPNRSTIDLDFTLDMTGSQELATASTLEQVLQQGCSRIAPRHGMRLAVHSVRNKPPGKDRSFVTMEARVGYALPDERRLIVRMDNRQTSPNVIPVEVSLNEPIHSSTIARIHQSLPPLRMCTLEDIVGEKLRALLQQPIRNRSRRQDVLDLSVLIRSNPNLNTAVIADALMLKANARNVSISRMAFHHPEIAERARRDYEALEGTTRFQFIPFDQAMTLVLAFVDTLPIPE